MILRELVERQASYLLICMRQRILNLPSAWAHRLADLKDAHEIRQALTGAAHEILDELADLPSKVTDPNWLQTVIDEEESPEERETPLAPGAAKAAAAKAEAPACEEDGDDAEASR